VIPRNHNSLSTPSSPSEIQFELEDS
jgi:hypothetical protein